MLNIYFNAADNYQPILTEAHYESSQSSKIEYFTKIVNRLKLLTIFSKRYILEALLGCEYFSA